MDKAAIRERVWDDLDESGVARFPFPPHERIPNYSGADEAADRLAATEAWGSAEAIKANPDAPQLPVRRRALRAGKTVYMAVPRLREAECFLRLDAAAIDDIDHATTVGGSSEVGVPVGPTDVDPIDLVVAGSVAVDRGGARIGKGEGYSDLEFAILAEFDRVDAETLVTTTVHGRQLLDGSLPCDSHDVSVDVICTPDETVRVPDPRPKPTGIDWSLLSEEDVEAMPVLAELER